MGSGQLVRLGYGSTAAGEGRRSAEMSSARRRADLRTLSSITQSLHRRNALREVFLQATFFRVVELCWDAVRPGWLTAGFIGAKRLVARDISHASVTHTRGRKRRVFAYPFSARQVLSCTRELMYTSSSKVPTELSLRLLVSYPPLSVFVVSASAELAY